MSVEHYSIIIEAPLIQSTEKIKDPTFWLPFLPGFNQLTSISDSTYLVDVFLSLGPIARKTLLTFYFQSNTEQFSSYFTFSSKNKHVTGLGNLLIFSYSDNEIKLQVSLDLNLTGRRSLLLIPLLPSVKETWAKNILSEVKNSLENKQ